MPRRKSEKEKKYPTSREWQVIWRLAWGYTYRDIAREFGITWRTAERHCFHASKKIGDGHGSQSSQVVRWFLINFPKTENPWDIDKEIKRKKKMFDDKNRRG